MAAEEPPEDDTGRSPMRVRKSLVRHAMMVLAGLLLLVAAFDIMWLHVVAGPPETDQETGELTSRGRSQQRTDYLWGTVFLVAGAALLAFGIAGGVGRVPVAVITDDELRLRIGGPRMFVSFPWSDVRWVHTGSDGDDELVPTRVLLVHVETREAYPDRLWGADWDGATVMVDAHAWEMRPSDVVTHATLALEAWRRRDAVVPETDVPGDAP